MRLFRGLLCLIGVLGVAACGGGGGSGSSSPPQQTLPPGRVSLTASTTSVEIGQSVTLAWSADGSACTASNGWSGSKSGSGSLAIGPLTQTTTFSLSCAATATKSASNGSVTVTVTNTPLPAPTKTRVVADSLQTSLDYLRIGAEAADLVWDPQHSRVLVVTQADSPLAPSSLMAIDATTGAAQTVSLSATPSAIAISADDLYVYVGFTQNGAIQRFLAADLTPDISFSVSGQTFSYVSRIEVSPVSAHTIAVIANNLTADAADAMPGLLIVDDGVARPNMFHGLMPVPASSTASYIYVTSANWSDDASHISVTLTAYSTGIVDLAVTPQGVSAESQLVWAPVTPIRIYGDRVFSDSGDVFSLEGPVEELGRMPDYNSVAARTESVARGKAFSMETHLAPGSVEDGTTINAYDLERFTYIDSITFNAAALFKGGKIITWGDDGLAMAGSDALIIAQGTFAAAGGIPPLPPPTTPAIVASGPIAGSSVSYQLLGTTARDVAADSCGHLYVATDRSAWLNPSSVLEMDVATGAVIGSVYIQGEPFNLAVSDDCGTLYAALDASNAVARVRVSDMTVDAVLPLGVESSGLHALLRGRSIGVAPGLARTVAIAKGDAGETLCSGSDDGVIIFDDLASRPVQYGQGDLDSIKSIVWGADASVLYGEDWNNVYAFAVDASGANSPRALFPYRVGTDVYDLGRDLYFDRGANRLYNSFGNVFDTATNTELTRIQLADVPGIINSCGTPSVARVSDQGSGKAFFVSYTTNALGIAAYDKASLGLLGRAVLDVSAYSPGFSWPLRVVRPASGMLAVVTATGQLILLQGQLLEP